MQALKEKYILIICKIAPWQNLPPASLLLATKMGILRNLDGSFSQVSYKSTDFTDLGFGIGRVDEKAAC